MASLGKKLCVLREWRCAFDWLSLLAFMAVLTMGFFCPAQKEDDAFLGLCKL